MNKFKIMVAFYCRHKSSETTHTHTHTKALQYRKQYVISWQSNYTTATRLHKKVKEFVWKYFVFFFICCHRCCCCWSILFQATVIAQNIFHCTIHETMVLLKFEPWQQRFPVYCGKNCQFIDEQKKKLEKWLKNEEK